MPRALTGLPTSRAQRLRSLHPKPMVLGVRLIAQPLQGLSLWTSRLGRRFKRSHQFHVLLKPRNHGYVPTFAQALFAGGVDVAHVSHDNIGPPLPAPPAMLHAGNQQATFSRIGRSRPTDQGHQQDPAFITLNPQPERVLLVTQEETALASLERAPTKGRALGRIVSGALFLCPEAEAGRSVASMSATETVPAVPLGSSGSNKCWLIWRKPLTPIQARNWLSIHTSGMAWRLGRWAKLCQSFCSGNIWTNRLKEWTGLSRANWCNRHNWAGLNWRRRPRPRLRGSSWLIKSSGTCGESSRSRAAVPVGGSNEFIAFRATLTNSLRLLQKRPSDMPGLKYSIPATYSVFPNTLYSVTVLGNAPASVRYSPADVVEVKKEVVVGAPDTCLICTSHIEKQNHILRMHCRRLTRLTNAFSKKLDNFCAAVALNFTYYNFCKSNLAIRMTPAQAAGIEKDQWTVAELVERCGQ